MAPHVRLPIGLLAAAAIVVASARCASPAGCAADAASGCTRVLFVGNSYTYENDLPGTFAELARSGGHEVEVGMVASGGWTLAEHAADDATLSAIRSKPWAFVVLQEQSQIPADAQSRAVSMTPAARSLATAARAVGAEPLLFETWPHRDGWPERGMSRAAMGAALARGYEAAGRDVGARVVAVGGAWGRATGAADLWQPDGTHPTAAGTYLAACVFYRSIFGASPVGLTYDKGLGTDVARSLQEAAAAG